MLPKKAADRLKRHLETAGIVDFDSLLRLMFPRATNTQVEILERWARGREKGRAAVRPVHRTPLIPMSAGQMQGEFFLVPTHCEEMKWRRTQDR